MPISVEEKRFILMSLEEMRDTFTLARSADDWFEPAEKLWQQYRKSTTMSLWDRFNYQQGVTGQNATPGYLVLYGATGSNISACMIDTQILPVINGVQPGAFVVDHKTYWYRCPRRDEAYFITALLNAPCVDRAIKSSQTRGIYVGPRDIHRRPFEICPIPQFDESNPEHQKLAALSQAAHTAVTTLDLSKGGVVAARKQARKKVITYIEQIDLIAQRMLELPSTSNIQPSGNYEEENDEELET
jgi:hypothetical protein